MRCFFSCLVKDVRLFFSRKSAVLVLVLPILLLAVLIPGFAETTSARTYVRPFRFAVCDLDDSVMSRSLISQLRQFELFEEIASVREVNSAESWFGQGYAALVTIPDNFFYAMYDMENLAVNIEFNPEMPTESAVLKAVFSSVTDIVAAEQKARLTEFRLQIQAGLNPDRQELYYESANYELKRALSRRNVFSDYQLIEDYTENSLKAAYATVTAMLCMLIPLCVLRGLPEELLMGIVDRLRCSGKGLYTLLLSKYFAALILFLLPFAIISAAAGLNQSPSAYISALTLFSFSFALFGIISISTSNASKAQLIGNILVVLFLLTGGALYPYQMLPRFVQKLAYTSPVFYYLRGINGRYREMVILFSVSVLLLISFFVICRNPLHMNLHRSVKHSVSTVGNREIAIQTGNADIVSVTWYKMLAMTGRRAMFLIMLAASIFCFYIVNCILDETVANEIIIAVADEDKTEISGEYIDALSSSEGVRVISKNEQNARKMLENGEAEAVLVLKEGFEKAFVENSAIPIDFYSSASGVSADAGREICAGILLSLQSNYDAVNRLVSAGVIKQEEKGLYFEELKMVEAEAKPIVTYKNETVGSSAEKSVYGRIYARYSGFVSLLIFLFLMSLSVLLSGTSSRAIKKAVSTVPRGYTLHVITDYLALVLAGVFLAAAALLCSSQIGAGEITAYFLYINCVAGICLLISLTRAGGGADMTASVLAMITGTVGGCFFDLSALGKSFKILSYFTPQGLLIGAISGSLICFIAMALIAVLCLSIYYFSGNKT